MSAHTTTVAATTTTEFGRRYQAECSQCDFKGELRRDRASAISDGVLHEATAGQVQSEDAA